MSTISFDVSDELVAKIAVDTVLARERRIRELEAKLSNMEAKYATFASVAFMYLRELPDRDVFASEWRRIKKEQGW